MTTLAALAVACPGCGSAWPSLRTLSGIRRCSRNRPPLLDNVTGGRFILGLGAGWHDGEHDQFGIPLPPIPERFDRFESAIEVLTSLFSDAARRPPGVTLPDRSTRSAPRPSSRAPLRRGGRRCGSASASARGIALAARFAEGWPMPGNRPGDVAYFAEKRDEIRRAIEAAGRDPDAFTFAAQMTPGDGRRAQGGASRRPRPSSARVRTT